MVGLLGLLVQMHALAGLIVYIVIYAWSKSCKDLVMKVVGLHYPTKKKCTDIGIYGCIDTLRSIPTHCDSRVEIR